MGESPTEKARVEIDGTTYILKPWGYEDGTRWAFRLSRLGATALGAHPSNTAAIAALLGEITEEDFVALRNVVMKHTEIEVTDDHERTKPVALDPQVNLKGRLHVVAALMKAHLEREFAPFFSRLGELLGDGAERKGS